MVAKNRNAREALGKKTQEKRRNSAHPSEHSRASSYKDKAKKLYNTFGIKGHENEHGHEHKNYTSATPQQNKDNQFLKKVTNFYLKNKDLEEEEIKLKSLKYLDKKGILEDKINKRYYKDNDIAHHLKIDQKQ